MATLTSEYQYLGRSTKIAPQSGNYGYYILLYAKTEANELTGIHSVTIRQILACTIDSSFYQYGTTATGTVNGVTAFSVSNRPSAAWSDSLTAGGITYRKNSIIAEGTVEVDATDGKEKNIALSTYWRFNVSSGNGYVPSQGASATVNVTVTLLAIPRSSTITATDANIGSTSIISIVRSSSSYLHDLYYRYLGDEDWNVIASRYSGEVYGWQIPTEAYNRIPDDPSVKIEIRCDTLNGDVLLGQSYCIITASVNANENKPIVTVKICEDINSKTLALTGDGKKIVRGYSDIRVVTEAEAKNGANVTSIEVSAGSKIKMGADVTLMSVESDKVTVNVTDSRGITETASVLLETIPYVILTANLVASRPSPTANSVSVSVSGNFYNGSFGATDNTITVLARANQVGGGYGEFFEIPSTVSGDTYTATGVLSDVSYRSIYDIEVVAYDLIADVESGGRTSTYRINKGIPLFDWGENDFCFHVPVGMPSEVPTFLSGKGTMDSTINNELSVLDGEKNGGYYKAIYLPLTAHSVLGAGPWLVEGFNNGASTKIQRVTTANLAVYLRLSSSGQWGDWVAVGITEEPYKTYTSGIWTVREWNNGDCELWGSLYVTDAVTTAWGGLYQGNNVIGAQVFPVVFSEVPTVQVSCVRLHGDVGSPWLIPNDSTKNTTTTQAGNYNLVSATAIASAKMHINYYVKGTI